VIEIDPLEIRWEEGVVMTYLVNRARQAVGLIRAVAWLGGW